MDDIHTVGVDDIHTVCVDDSHTVCVDDSLTVCVDDSLTVCVDDSHTVGVDDSVLPSVHCPVPCMYCHVCTALQTLPVVDSPSRKRGESRRRVPEGQVG